METLHERCCGLDVHQKTVMACLLTPGSDAVPAKCQTSIRMALAHIPGSCRLLVIEEALAKQGEARPAIHLALQRLQLVHPSF